MATSSNTPEVLFNEFYSEVKAIEQRDAVLTSEQQISRLNRPGSTYFNLNPYDVLQVDPDTPMTEVKKKYRQMSLLVHPDKNQHEKDRAQKSFEAVNRAYRTLDDEDTQRKCKEVVEEAKEIVHKMMEEKRNRLRKAGKSTLIDEDEHAKYKHAIYVQTCKLFADLERLRVDEEMKQSNEKKRKAQDDDEEKKQMAYEKEWNKNFEASRQERVDSWRNFTAKKAKKSKKAGVVSFKPPKPKMEQRPQ